MVFERRTFGKINYKMKNILAILLAVFFMTAQAGAIAVENPVADNVIASSSVGAKKNATDVLKGSVSVDITPYYANWSSQEAFNHINRIGTRLAMASDLEKHMTFVVSDDKEANASTNINNVITVNLGLLKYVENEDELAFVIGHEMGHVSKTHVKKTIARNAVVATAGITGSVLSMLGYWGDSAKMAKAGAITVGGAAAGEIANKAISRGDEFKADTESIDYLVNAGYNPLASISLMNKISGNYFDAFSDHPSGGKRIKKMYKYISKNYPEYIEKGYNSTSYERALQFINK